MECSSSQTAWDRRRTKMVVIIMVMVMVRMMRMLIMVMATIITHTQAKAICTVCKMKPQQNDVAIPNLTP